MDIKNIIKAALKEDLGRKDVTTRGCIPRRKKIRAEVIARDKGIFCSLGIPRRIFSVIKAPVKVDSVKEGSRVKKGDRLLVLEGDARAILSTERVLMNFLQQLSGVATEANLYASKTTGNTKILDTRKTLPGLRRLQKYAVKCGGAKNHRNGLYDMILIKDNHIKIAGSIKEAVRRIRKKYGYRYRTEVECTKISEVKEAMETDCEWIMLDNMTDDKMRKALNIINGEKITEASGNMNPDRIRPVSKLGVDYISVGSMTHSYKALDMSMRIK